MEAALLKADAVYSTLNKSKPQVAVVTGAGGTLLSSTSQPTATGTTDQVAATSVCGRGRGRWNSGRGRGRGNKTLGQTPNTASGSQGSNPSSKYPGVPRHSDNPPDTVCRQHWRFGRSAHYCTDRVSCPWRDILTPRPAQ